MHLYGSFAKAATGSSTPHGRITIDPRLDWRVSAKYRWAVPPWLIPHLYIKDHFGIGALWSL